MIFDKFESAINEVERIKMGEKMAALRHGFSISEQPQHDTFSKFPQDIGGNIAHWLGVEASKIADESFAAKESIADVAKQVYHGVDLGDGRMSLGLEQIHNWRINPDYYDQNLRQHAGYAAEVISTAKENLKAALDESGLTTYRADDRPDLFQKNDQFVDKIRVDSNGNVVERIQTKFVGKDAEGCLSKLASKDYDKYFESGKVDKIEIPKDYYKGVKELIPEKINGLEKQLARVTEEGKTDVAKTIEAKIDRYKTIDKMVEQSMVSSNEALEAVKHPGRYAARLFAEDTFMKGHDAGMESAAIAATITAAVTTVDNTMKFMNGEITAQEAFIDVVKDTGAAGGIAYGTSFISTAVSQVMSTSSCELISSLGSAGVPAVVISFGVQSFDSITDFGSGVIDAQQLVYDLGENAAQVGGAVAGSALAGAAVGSIVPGAGTAVGFGAGLVGGMVGCAIASEAYVSAVEVGSEGAEVLAEKAQVVANLTVEMATETIPNHASNIAASLNDFAAANNLPFRV